MRTVEGAALAKGVTTHAAFLANVSRHFVSLEIEPMLEAVGRSSLGVLGDVCTVDRISESPPTRILEVRTVPDAWMEAPVALAATVRGEVRFEGERSRISVPIGMRSDRFGVLSFARYDGAAHGAADLSLAQELGERLSLAIRNAREHMEMAAALGARERLISIAAHELRNPLCSVRFCLQSLERHGATLASPAAKMLEIMARGERKIARLIDDLLDLGRIRAGQMEMELAPFDLCDVIRDVSTLMEAQTTETGSTLHLELDGPVVGRWDRARLDQVVSNLLANAVKYGQGRPVVIRAGADPQRGVGWLAVIDQGLGIEPELQEGARTLHRPGDHRPAGRRGPRGEPPRDRVDVRRGVATPGFALTPSRLSPDGKADPQGVCSGNS
jgi:signal transduction histidine kinase